MIIEYIPTGFQGFRRSEQFRVFLGHVRLFVEQIEEVQHYEVLSLAEGAPGEEPL